MESARIRVGILIELEVSLDGKAKARKIVTLDLVIRPIEGIGYGSVISFLL